MTRQEREARARRTSQLALIASFMSTPLGREYYYNLLASCHVYATSFSTNALVMANLEGERNIGLRIGADLTEASPEMYLLMLKEAGNGRHSRVERTDDGFSTRTDDDTDNGDTAC